MMVPHYDMMDETRAMFNALSLNSRKCGGGVDFVLLCTLCWNSRTGPIKKV